MFDIHPFHWDWLDIGKTVLAAGVGSGLAQIIRDVITRRMARRDHQGASEFTRRALGDA